MTLPYRSFTRNIGYVCPSFEAALLTRTTQRSVGLSKSKAQQGVSYVVSMYGCLPQTPLADAIVTSMAWYPAACDVPWAWLRG